MSTDTVGSLRQRMIEDMNARKLCVGTQRSHIHSCKRFAAFLKRSPDTATSEDIRRFQLHLSETSASICNRNRVMTGVRFLFRVTLRRLDLAAEIYHLVNRRIFPLVMSQEGWENVSRSFEGCRWFHLMERRVCRQERTSSAQSVTSEKCRYCCRSRKSISPTNLAKVDFWTSLRRVASQCY